MPVHKSVRLQFIRDGASNTIGFAERVMGDFQTKSYSPFQDVAELSEVISHHALLHSLEPLNDLVGAAQTLRNPNPVHDSSSGLYWVHGGLMDTWYTHVLPPNSTVPDVATTNGMFGEGIVTARSWHDGGVNVLRLDGAVSFTSASIDTRIWRALGTRSGGD